MLPLQSGDLPGVVWLMQRAFEAGDEFRTWSVQLLARQLLRVFLIAAHRLNSLGHALDCYTCCVFAHASGPCSGLLCGESVEPFLCQLPNLSSKRMLEEPDDSHNWFPTLSASLTRARVDRYVLRNVEVAMLGLTFDAKRRDSGDLLLNLL
jgi:hypothetical protein